MAVEKRPPQGATPIDEEQFVKASERGQRLQARSVTAQSARYAAGRIHVELSNGCAFAFPVAHAEGLVGATVAQLRDIEISGAGLSLVWPRLDADLYVPSLARGVLGTKQWMARIGSVGGSVVTQAKSAAARANGQLGGRPRLSAAATESKRASTAAGASSR
jgi:Protein of unknown function (DUF2442)